MNGKAVIKILEHHGFKCLRIKGSHFIMGNGHSKPFPVPVHGSKDLKAGTLKNIERLSGVKLK